MRQRRGSGDVRCAGSVIRSFVTVKGPSDSEAHEPAVISGILIRNSLQSPGHMLLLVFNNGKSSCFEVGLDFGKQPQEAFGAQPGRRTSWKMCFWLKGRCDSNWHRGMPSSGRSQRKKLRRKLQSCYRECQPGGSRKGSPPAWAGSW